MALKRTSADIAFSKCVRERVSWTCERCGSWFHRNAGGLECSHFHGRGKWGLRFDPDNAFSLCTGCHFYLGSHPTEHQKWVEGQIGAGMMEILQERANDTSLGRIARRSAKEIAKHYRNELARLERLRDEGETRRIELENWT